MPRTSVKIWQRVARSRAVSRPAQPSLADADEATRYYAKALKINRRQMLCNVQGFVADKMVFHGDIMGMPLSRAAGVEA